MGPVAMVGHRVDRAMFTSVDCVPRRAGCPLWGLEVRDQPKGDVMNAEPGLVVTGTGLWRVGGRAGMPLSGRNWGDRLMGLNSAPNMPQLGRKEGSIRASHLVEA